MKVTGKFTVSKPGRKWEYATIKLRAPRGWRPFHEYNWGPSLSFDGAKMVITVRRKKRK